MKRRHALRCALLGISTTMLASVLLAGCSGDALPQDGAMHEEPRGMTNRVDIPPAVRTNLGLTFAQVEQRKVASTMRVPGRFELLPSARREYRTPMTGRAELLVSQYQVVNVGDVLYRLDAPAWRDLQRELTETSSAIDIARARLVSLEAIMEAHKLHEQGLREAVALWTRRIEQLEALGAAGGGRAAELAEAQANQTNARASFGEVMEKDAELQLQRSETEANLRGSAARLELLQTTAAALQGVPVPMVTDDDVTVPLDGVAVSWSHVPHVEVRATMAGVVEQLAVTNGAWAEEGELILSVVDPHALRFRAMGLQSDLQKLRSGLEATIVPPGSGKASISAPIPTSLEIGLDADPQQRTIELLATPTRTEAWARPGVAAFLEIVIDSSAASELAIPLSCVVRDGLVPIIFRRDPANPDKVIRLEADLGLNDGRWVVIHSGVKAGDEIVLDGVYPLLLATSGSIAKGGHFHADGTFHADDH